MGMFNSLFGWKPSPPDIDRPSERDPGREIEDRRASAPAGAIVLIAGAAGVDIVGESLYRSAIEAAVGGRNLDGVKMYLTATIHAEATNAFDRSAVVIELGGRTVGYLAASDAKRYRAAFTLLAQIGQVGSCSAQIRGGWDRGDGEIADYGVTVYIDAPERLLQQLERH